MSGNGLRGRYTSRIQRDREGVRVAVRELVALSVRPRGHRRGAQQVARMRRAAELLSTSDESITSRHAFLLRSPRPHRQNILETEHGVGVLSVAVSLTPDASGPESRSSITLRSLSSHAWHSQRAAEGSGPAGDYQWSSQNAATRRPNHWRVQPNNFRNEGVVLRINHGNVRRARGHDVRYRINAAGFRAQHVPRDRRRRSQRDRPLRRLNRPRRDERKARRRPGRPFTLTSTK